MVPSAAPLSTGTENTAQRQPVDARDRGNLFGKRAARHVKGSSTQWRF